MGLSIAIAFAAYEVPRARRRQQFRTSPFARGERALTINENGIATTFPNATAQYGWQAFTRYRETDLSILLFTSPYSIGVWIPKREMSPQQIDELRHILKARLPVR
jgi:SRSO17 transposase